MLQSEKKEVINYLEQQFLLNGETKTYKKISCRNISKKLNIKFSHVVNICDKSEYTRKVMPIEVGSNRHKLKLNIYEFYSKNEYCLHEDCLESTKSFEGIEEVNQHMTLSHS